MSKKIAIFDMDGTLIDSSVGITNSINFVRASLGLSPLAIRTVVDAINSEQRNLALIFYEKPIYESKERDLFESHYYDECIKEVTAYTKIPQLLETLAQEGILCSVATNAPATFAKRMLGHLDLAKYFDHILGADTHRSKPDGHMLIDILDNYGYDEFRDYKPLMVGDNLKDLEAAKNARVKGVHVTWGFAQFKHETSINEPFELLKHIDTK